MPLKWGGDTSSLEPVFKKIDNLFTFDRLFKKEKGGE